MNPSRAGGPSGARDLYGTGSSRNPSVDPHSHGRTQGFNVNTVGQGPPQTYTSVGGPSNAWYYESSPQGASHPQVSASSAGYHFAGPPTQQEETYARQYQQWAQSFANAPQQQSVPFPAQPPGGQAYHHDPYMGQPGGSYNRPPDNTVGGSQGAFAQQFNNPTTHRGHSSVNPAYSELYGLVGGATAGQPPTQLYQPSQNAQVSGQYPSLPQQRPIGEHQPSQLPQQETPGYMASAQKPRHPSTDSTLSNSPGSWPNEVLDATPSAGATNFQFKMHKPTPRASGKQYPTQAHLPVPGVGGASGIKESNSAPPSIGRARKRKRVKRGEDTDAEDGDSAAESDDDDSGFAGGISVGVAGLGVVQSGKGRSRHSRLPGACKHCKKLKMKCEFPKGDQSTCLRCRATGYACIVEGRKPRNAPNKREYLLAQIRQKDSVIESLLKQLHNPYIATPLSIASYRLATPPSDRNNQDVLEWLDQLQSSVKNTGSKLSSQVYLKPREKEANEESGNEAAAVGDDAGETSDSDGQSPEAQIESSLPDTHVPLGLIANLSLSNTQTSKKQKKKEDTQDAITLVDDDDDVGVANETYFMPGPATDLGIRASLIQQHSPPEILVHGLVTPEDVNKLFDIFFDRINPFTSLLDRAIHTPETTFARCPFLFTVVCAVASRFYTEKSQVYPVAMHFAKSSAATALIDGWKSVELCQAYILMATYAVPARRWEEDRSWLYTGLAIRIATDLNLHQVSTVKPTSEKQEREILNKTRVWMICYNLDRSTATQFGKPSTIKEDFIVRNAKDWYKQSKYNHMFDIHLCGYSALLQIVARFHDEIFSDPSSPTGLNKKVDFRAVTLEHDECLIAFEKEWTDRFDKDSKPENPGCKFRRSLMPFLVSYSRLVMFSFGFQQALLRGLQAGDEIYFTKCLESAKSVIVTMLDSLAPSGYMRYAPDGHFVFASFASAFLLKLLRPELSKYLTKEGENEIFDLISRLITTLSSTQIAIDNRHTPSLYARFLAGLLFKHRRDGVTVGRLQTQPPPKDPTGPTTGGSMSAFSVSPPIAPHGSSTSGYGMQGGSSSGQAANPGDSIIFTPEATFGSGTGPIQFGTSDITSYSVNAFTEEETLATMQVINNPAWWKDMLMPGFSGSWPEASPSPAASGPSSSDSPHMSSGSAYQRLEPDTNGFVSDMVGFTGGYNIFHSAQMGSSQIPLF